MFRRFDLIVSLMRVAAGQAVCVVIVKIHYQVPTSGTGKPLHSGPTETLVLWEHVKGGFLGANAKA